MKYRNQGYHGRTGEEDGVRGEAGPMVAEKNLAAVALGKLRGERWEGPRREALTRAEVRDSLQSGPSAVV